MKKIISILLVILMSFSLFNKVAFADTVTKEDLEEAIENFLAYDEKNTTTISVDDKYINMTITDNDEDSETYGTTNDYQIEYDLSDKPTYKIEANIKKGMTYDEYEKEISKAYILSIAYILTLNCLEVSVEDSTTYFMLSLLGNAFGSLDEDVLANQKYFIVDDDSEFGNKAIDYFNETYKDSTMSDSEVNSYQLTSVRSDIDSDNIKVTSTLTVNTSADLSKIKGFKDSLGSGFEEVDTSVLNSLNVNNELDSLNEDQDAGESSNENNEENNYENNNNLDGNKVLGSTTNPGTGINSYVYIGIGCILLTIIVLIVNNKIHKKSTL